MRACVQVRACELYGQLYNHMAFSRLTHLRDSCGNYLIGTTNHAIDFC